ncbi:Crp/Fnr family transcriptional regulator [Teredinibacter purpureus]|uniref:Crp/Fnr family transcriptional regulator n=1 Tax=Teredinibacter purpureus TaxID=2731756 RepID=UPI0005F7B987|nr:Crp/Fnr family transcriptional regulator [Teredinibacter purpureus]
MFDKYREYGTRIGIHKGEYLFEQGKVVDNLYVIESGLLKACYITNEGKEYIKSFVTEGSFISCAQSLLHDQPSTFSVLSLEDCTLFKIHQSTLKTLRDTDPKFSEDVQGLLLQLTMKKERREYELLCLSAEERYRLFRTRQPELEKRLSQSDVARYLGITPVGLSRIRKRCNTSTD